MEAIKALLVAGLGLGVTWAAAAVTGGGPPGAVRLAQAQTPPAAADAPASGESQGEDVRLDVPELSDAELEAELRRLEEVVGESEEELKEFRPQRPLPADLPVPLPSDI